MNSSSRREFQTYLLLWLFTILFLVQVYWLVTSGEIRRFGIWHRRMLVYADHPVWTLLELFGYFVLGPLPLLSIWLFDCLDALFKRKPPPPRLSQADLLEDPSKVSQWREPPQ